MPPGPFRRRNCRSGRRQSWGRDPRPPVDIPLTDGRIEAPIYDRAQLGAGDHIDGPAIITQLGATTLLLLGQTGRNPSTWQPLRARPISVSIGPRRVMK